MRIDLPREKYAEGLANEIADALHHAPHAKGRVRVFRDPVADTWAVRVTFDRVRYDLLMPAPGSFYALFRRRVWVGFGIRSDALPVDVAGALLRRIEQVHR